MTGPWIWRYSERFDSSDYRQIGTAGGTGWRHRICGRGDSVVIDGRTDDRMQHGIEAGARVGLVAVDEKTIEYVRGRPLAPRGETGVAQPRPGDLVSDPDANLIMKSL